MLSCNWKIHTGYKKKKKERKEKIKSSLTFLNNDPEDILGTPTIDALFKLKGFILH